MIDPIVMEALIVKTPDSLVRVILGSHCLDLGPDDILDIEELPPPPGLIPGRAVFARISIQAGARLMRIVSASAYQSILWARANPFVFATRTAPAAQDCSDLEEKEQAFYQLRGIHIGVKRS